LRLLRLVLWYNTGYGVVDGQNYTVFLLNLNHLLTDDATGNGLAQVLSHLATVYLVNTLPGHVGEVAV
jgi:hypothetical protein